MVGFGLKRSKVADGVANALENRELGVITAVSVATAGGIVGADVIANRVLPMVGISADPQSLVDAGASVTLKMLIALGIGVAAADMTGIPQLALVFLAVGTLASAGADILTVFVDLPQLAQMKRRVRSNSPSRSTSTSASSSQTRQVKQASPSTSRQGSLLSP